MSDKKKEIQAQESIPPMGIRMIAREFKKDKIAIFSLGLLVVLLLTIFIGAMLTNQEQVMFVSIFDKYAEPGAISMEGHKYLLGADEGGRDVLGQLFIGARNSVVIGFTITLFTSIIGVGLS